MAEGNALWLLNTLIGVVLAGMAWWMNTMWGEVKAVQKRIEEREADTRKRLHDQAAEITKLNVLVVGGYVTREELRESMREMTTAVTNRIDRMSDQMDSQLKELYGELKHKVDKP